VFFEDDEPLTPGQVKKYGYRLIKGIGYRLISLAEFLAHINPLLGSRSTSQRAERGGGKRLLTYSA
jgi:hypothetical protein